MSENIHEQNSLPISNHHNLHRYHLQTNHPNNPPNLLPQKNSNPPSPQIHIPLHWSHHNHLHIHHHTILHLDSLSNIPSCVTPPMQTW